jgi:cytochrome P450
MKGDPVARLVTPSGRRNPYPAYRQVRETEPLVPTMIGWVTADHALASAVLRDHDRFGVEPIPDAPRPQSVMSKVLMRLRSGEGDAAMAGRRVHSDRLFEEVPDPLGTESMIGMDPPDHTRVRRLVSRAFTPRAIARVRARVEEVADQLLDEADGGRFEVMSGYAGVLPVVVISELLGIPPSDWEKVKRWGDVLAAQLDVMGGAPDYVFVPALTGLGRYLRELFAERRRNPGDRVIDALIADSEAEGGLNDRELTATAMLLLTAGFETTVNMIGNGVLALLEHPDQKDRLLADPALGANLVEEVLRYESPVQMTARMIRQDTELGGRRLRRGGAVIVMLGGGNRDPQVFPDPDRFDIARPNAREHLSFASGIHHCLGASLARLEGEVALTKLFQRYPDLRLDGPVKRGRGLILRGPRELPVRLTP